MVGQRRGGLKNKNFLSSDTTFEQNTNGSNCTVEEIELVPKFVVGVLGVLTNNDKVLALKRSTSEDVSPGVWETVAGKVELGEDPLTAVRREIEEEIGLVGNEICINPSPVTAIQTARGDDPMVLMVYKASYLSGEIAVSREHEAYRWVSVEEFRELSSYKNIADIIREQIFSEEGKSNAATMEITNKPG